MGQGLGKNSPVVLRLGKENYEALLDRHGQFVRWRRAQRCTCIDKVTFAPNIRCTKCGGRGFIYDCQTTADSHISVMAWDDSGIIEISEEYKNAALLKCYDSKGNLINAEKYGTFIQMEKTPVKGEYYNFIIRDPLVLCMKKNEAVKLSGNYYQIPNLRVRRSGIDNIHYTAACDILSIGKITDANGTEYQAKELRQDCFYIEGENIADPVTVENISYVKPSVFAILNQNLNKADSQMVVEANGDGVVTFPYSHDVSENDVITVLSGTVTKKETVNRMKYPYDIISAFFVDSVEKCTGKNRDYIQGEDFFLVGTNRIHWSCTDSPAEGETYSIIYKVFPSYVVMKNIPQLRSSEDQHLPKKAVIKYYNSYSEMTKVNRQ